MNGSHLIRSWHIVAMVVIWTGILLGSCHTALHAQDKEYMYEIGFGVGMSVSYGDINKTSPLYNPGLAADLLLRYNINPRWAVAMDLGTYSLKGDSRDFDNVFPQQVTYQYDSRYWQLGIRPEFTFWSYGWSSDYREKKRIAPFLTMGIGAGLATGNDDNSFAFSIPIGAGFKWKMAPRWNSQLTCLFTKTFSDGLDGIDDPYGIESSALKNTDWVGSLILSITFDFKERCVECHNQDSF